MTGKTWFRYENGLLVLLGLTFGLAFFDRNAVGFLGQYIVPDLGLSNEQFGLLGSGLAVAWALSAYVLGALSDRTGKRKAFLIGIVLVFSCCSIFSGMVKSFLPLLAARLIMGVAEGPFLPICLGIMVMESSVNRRGINAGILQTLFSALLGSTVAPLVLVPLAEQFGWRSAFYLSGAPGLICALLIALWIREPVAPDAPAPAAVGNAPQPAEPGLLAMLGMRNILLCCLISCAMVAWMLVTQLFLPRYLTDHAHYSALDMSHAMSVLGFSAAFFAFVAPALSDRIGRRPVLVVVCLISMLCPLAAMIYHGPLIGLGFLMFIGWMGAGGFALFMGVVPAETLNNFGRAATSMGLVVCLGELSGGSLGPWLAGKVADMTQNLAMPMYIAAGCALAGAIFAAFLKETAPAVLQKSAAQSR